MALINQRVMKLDTSEIVAELKGFVAELKRLNYNLENIFHVNAPELVPDRDFDADDFSSVSYSDEVNELVQQHLDKRIGGVRV